MNRVIRAALIAALIPLALFAADAKKQRPSKQYTIEQFLNTVGVAGASFSPDEKEIVFSSNKTGIWNVYSVPVTGGEPKALTTSTTDSTYSVGYFPHDRRFLYTRDQGGNELNHLYVRELEGTERDLTPGEKLKAGFAGWSGDKKSFYVTTNERDPKFIDVYRYDAKTYERELVYKAEPGFQFSGVSKDGRWIALVKANTTADNDLFLYEVAKKETKKISEHTGTASFNPTGFDPQSKHLYILTDEGSEFTRAIRYELASGKREEVEKSDWDIWSTSFSEKGKYRVTRINHDARTVVKLYDGKSGKPLPLPKLPNGDVTNVIVSPSEKLMAVYVSGDRSPANLFVYDFATAKSTRLSDSISKDLDAADLVDSSVVRFKSFDGMTIPGILYKPHQATPKAKAPAIVLVHGGPGGQARKGYSSVAQYLVNHGYVILDINNRGSSGYGKTFFTADDRKHGKEPLWDCLEAKKYLTSLPYVDGDRIAIMGGSYGGYMVAAALAFHPDAFDVGVDIFGVTNWVRTLKNIPPWWEAQRKALYDEMGDPEAELDRLTATSPLFHAAKIKRPLIVIQGKNDPRVIQVESDELVDAVRKNNIPVEYVVFDDEGHGFSKKKNQIVAYGKILEFLDTHLKGKKTS